MNRRPLTLVGDDEPARPDRPPVAGAPGPPHLPGAAYLTRDLLDRTAAALPAAVGPYPMLSGDLHTTLYHTAAQLLPAVDTEQAHRLADRAEAVLAEYLVAVCEARSGDCVTRTLRGWLVGQPTPTVARALRAAALWCGSHWRPVGEAADPGERAAVPPIRRAAG